MSDEQFSERIERAMANNPAWQTKPLQLEPMPQKPLTEVPEDTPVQPSAPPVTSQDDPYFDLGYKPPPFWSPSGGQFLKALFVMILALIVTLLALIWMPLLVPVIVVAALFVLAIRKKMQKGKA